MLRDASIAAAQAGDVEQATKWIVEGRALWNRMGLAPPSKFPEMQQWIAWTDAYLREHRDNELA